MRSVSNPQTSVSNPQASASNPQTTVSNPQAKEKTTDNIQIEVKVEDDFHGMSRKWRYNQTPQDVLDFYQRLNMWVATQPVEERPAHLDFRIDDESINLKSRINNNS